MNYRNAQYNNLGTIDCEIEHPDFGWIPFTADPNDVEPLGRDVFAAAQGTATPYVAPDPAAVAAQQLAAERARMVVSRFQARAALMNAGLLASAEAAISGASDLAQLAWQDAQEFRRNSPTVLAIATALGITETELDDLFRHAADIEA